jgi:hypothetical protein
VGSQNWTMVVSTQYQRVLIMRPSTGKFKWGLALN